MVLTTERQSGIGDQIHRRGNIAWLKEYLNGEGNNPKLWRGIQTHARHLIGPKELSLSRLRRISGPEAGIEYPAEPEEWERVVARYYVSLELGASFPPLIAIDFLDSGIVVGDGNKRYEALKRAGFVAYPTILCLKEDPRTYGFPSIR